MKIISRTLSVLVKILLITSRKNDSTGPVLTPAETNELLKYKW